MRELGGRPEYNQSLGMYQVRFDDQGLDLWAHAVEPAGSQIRANIEDREETVLSNVQISHRGRNSQRIEAAAGSVLPATQSVGSHGDGDDRDAVDISERQHVLLVAGYDQVRSSCNRGGQDRVVVGVR